MMSDIRPIPPQQSSSITSHIDVTSSHSTPIDTSHTIPKIELPDITENEEICIKQFMQESGLPLSQIHRLDSKLKERLAYLEAQNIQTLFSSEKHQKRADTILTELEKVHDLVVDMSQWMTRQDRGLTKMKVGIAAIESRNKLLDLQERNYGMLAELLQHMLVELEIDNSTIEVLKQPSIPTSRSAYKKVIKAVTRLHEGMQRRLPGGLERLTAVKEKRVAIDGVRKHFAESAYKFFSTQFQIEAEGIETKRKDSSISLVSHASVHSSLLRFDELAAVLELLSTDVFIALRKQYLRLFKTQYETQFIAYFDSVNNHISKTRIDCSMKNMLSEQQLSPKSNASLSLSSRRSFRLRSTSSSRFAKSNVGHDNNVVSAIDHHDETMQIVKTFVYAVETAIPIIEEEQEFFLSFFGIKAEDPYEDDVDDGAVSADENEEAITHRSAGQKHVDGEENEVDDGDDGASTPDDENMQLFDEDGEEDFETQTIIKQNERDSLKMLRVLFDGFTSELVSLVNRATEISDLNTVEIVVVIERMLVTQNSAELCSAVIDMIKRLKSCIKSKLVDFVSKQVSWIQHLRFSPKRCGVLPPFRCFPMFVNRLENTVERANGGLMTKRPTMIDHSYTRIASVMFEWLQHHAKQDPKYSAVVLMENAYAFWSQLQHISLSCLATHLSLARSIYEEQREAYVIWNIAYALPEINEFFTLLNSQALALSSSLSDVAFTPGLTKQDLRILLKTHLNQRKLVKRLSLMLQRLQKHLNVNQSRLLVEVWTCVKETFVIRFENFDELVSQCYPAENIALTVDQVAALFMSGPCSAEDGITLSSISQSTHSQ